MGYAKQSEVGINVLINFDIQEEDSWGDADVDAAVVLLTSFETLSSSGGDISSILDVKTAISSKFLFNERRYGVGFFRALKIKHLFFNRKRR